MTKNADNEILNPGPPRPELILALGYVNFAWAQLDAIVAASLSVYLRMPPVDVGLLVGRVETDAKLKKLKKLALHRRDSDFAAKLARWLKTLKHHRPLRNAVTHGYFVGETSQAESIFSILPEFLVDPTEETAVGMVATTDLELYEHNKAVLNLATEIMNHFGADTLRPLFDLPARVRP